MRYIVMVARKADSPTGVGVPENDQWKAWDMWATATEHSSPEEAAQALAKGQNWTDQRLVCVMEANMVGQFWVKPERSFKAERTGNVVRSQDGDD